MSSPPLRAPPALREGASPSPPVSCLLFFITQQMTYLIGVPSCRFPLPAFSENKAGNPFIFILPPFPSSVFSKDRLPASLAQWYPVEQAVSSELTILTFLLLVIFLKHDNHLHEDTVNLFFQIRKSVKRKAFKKQKQLLQELNKTSLLCINLI